jgi:hypothetical protein
MVASLQAEPQHLSCVQWFCDHEDDGSLRDPPLDPRLTTPDLAAKITMYMWWVSKNCPGYHTSRKAAVMVSDTVQSSA